MEPQNSSSDYPTIKVKVKHDSSVHRIRINSHASFGELKEMLAGPTGVLAQHQKLIFKQKEKNSQSYLDAERVKDGSMLVLIEDIESREQRIRKTLKLKKLKTTKSDKQINMEVDKLTKKFFDEQCYDEEVRQHMEQLMNAPNCPQVQAQSRYHQLNSPRRTTVEQNEDESGPSKTKKFRGPTLLKDIWNMPQGKTIVVRFNDRDQAVGKEGRKLASFLGIVARTPELAPLNINDWRVFDKDEKRKLVEFVRKKFSIPPRGEEFVKQSLGRKWKDYKCDLKSFYMTKYKNRETLLKNKPDRIPRDQWTGLVSYWLSDKAKRRSQVNKNSRRKQKMPHTGGSKSIGTLMDEKAIDGIEPNRAEVFIFTHTKRKDGRPLDEDSEKTAEMMREKMKDSETSIPQSLGSVAWEGDVYSQVLGSERSGYVRGLGLGPTPSKLWGNKYNFGDMDGDNMRNEGVKKLEQEMRELKECQENEMKLMKENQENLLLEVSSLKQLVQKLFCHPHNSQCSSLGQDVPNAYSGHGPALHMSSREFMVVKNTTTSPGAQLRWQCKRKRS